MAGRNAPFRREGPRWADEPDDVRAEREEREARERARNELDVKVRARIGRRAGQVGTASPYDLLADALMNTLADGLIEALVSPDFEEALRSRGYAVVPICDQPPTAPVDWLTDAADLAAGRYADLVDVMDSLWERAWRAGRESPPTDPAPVRDDG
jgi:hypothetical protein